MKKKNYLLTHTSAPPFIQLRALYEISNGAVADVKGSAPVLVESPGSLMRVNDKCGVANGAIQLQGTETLSVRMGERLL
jgi:hypothetical protein